MNAKISEIKAKFSEFIRRVRRGATIVVLDRETPVARIVPHENGREDLRLEPAPRPACDIGKARGVRLRRAADVDRLLAESRGDR
ncbi:MAG: type II toxin-antitoxin system prevent-host-death family antitoxin [Planctomycetes bacterium]|nr:type II toxin-antitoxin system prevent-host-death family antitoxin [Planctomycetota bacterium]